MDRWCVIGDARDAKRATLEIGNYSHSHYQDGAFVRLSHLPRHASATVRSIEPTQADDPIAQRLAALGFVRGEVVRLISQGPFGGDPLLVQVGLTRFALRRSEAARVWVDVEGQA